MTYADQLPAYVTVADAAAAMGVEPAEVVTLVEREEVRGITYGPLVLVSSYDVETLGGVAPRIGHGEGVTA